MQVTQNKITRQASSDLWLLLKFLIGVLMVLLQASSDLWLLLKFLTGVLRVLLHSFYRVLMLLDNA